MAQHIAVDIGAGSGRIVAGTFSGKRLETQEVHRFTNGPVRTPDGQHWDVLRLFMETLEGIRAARAHGPIRSVGVDTWAVDYGLLDGADRLLGNPYHYRDARTDGVRERVASICSATEQFARTGIAQLPFNTLYQLVAQAQDPLLEHAATLLMIPDLLHFWLCGTRSAERTNASTSGALDLDGTWALDLLQRVHVPTQLFLQPTPAGATLGVLRDDVRRECGVACIDVIAPATHDTASAIVAIPAAADPNAEPFAFISSGTWSLFGLELARPLATEDVRRAGFTNEAGFGGTTRFLTNIMGLWLLQECRRMWQLHGLSLPYDAFLAKVAAQPSPGVVIDTEDPAFLRTDDMLAAIAAQLRRTGQRELHDAHDIARAIIEGLALRYRAALNDAERLAGIRVAAIHIVGGGARNELLCRLAANACARVVIAGPFEATAIGNLLVQLIACGELDGIAQAREVVRNSTKLRTYEPLPDPALEANARRLGEICAARC